MKTTTLMFMLLSSLSAFAQSKQCVLLNAPVLAIALEKPDLVAAGDLAAFKKHFPQNKMSLGTGAVKACIEYTYSTDLVFYNSQNKAVASFDGMVRGSMESNTDFDFLAQNFNGFSFTSQGKLLKTEAAFKNPYKGINLLNGTFKFTKAKNNKYELKILK